MKISLITAAYNSATTIGDTLRSVAEQTYPNVEHIVIDGASTDNTLKVIHGHSGHLIHVVSERDHGIYDALNKGLRLATGDFVGFLNADDVFAHKNVLRLVADSTGPGAPIDAVYGDLVYVMRERPHRVLRRWRSGGFSPSRLRFGWMPPHPTFYVRKTLLDELGGFDTELRIAADYDFMLRCLLRPGVRVHYLPEVLVRMRIGGASNRSLMTMLRKSSEDLRVMQRNDVGGWFTLLCKNTRKLSQFFAAN